LDVLGRDERFGAMLRAAAQCRMSSERQPTPGVRHRSWFVAQLAVTSSTPLELSLSWHQALSGSFPRLEAAGSLVYPLAVHVRNVVQQLPRDRALRMLRTWSGEPCSMIWPGA